MKEQFNFKYVAPTEEERKEIASIRKQYCKKEESETKLDRLRRLDATVKNTPVIISLILGVLGTLIFGLGLTCVLEWNLVVLGLILGAVGVIPMAIAYPVYSAVLKANKRKYGEEILKLSEELLNEKE